MGIVMDNKPSFEISPQLVRLIAEIDEFKGRWSALGQLAPDRLQALKTIATIESIGSSTRIEGAKLSDQEVEQLLSGLHTSSFRSRDEEEVQGYAEAMVLVFDSYTTMSLSENIIKQLHSILLKYSSKDLRHRGDYKKMPNHVEAFDAKGKSIGIIFETASPFETPMKMQTLVTRTVCALEEKKLHSLLVIAAFILKFLAIHPFQDGNGRLSRILTTLLLLKTGYAYVPYSSLEHVIESNKDGYYRALRHSQRHLETDKENLNEWIIFFLHALKSQKDNLLKKVEREQLFIQLPELSQQIISLAKAHGRITNIQIHLATQASRNTIKSHLQKLVAQGLLAQHGKGKGSWYS